MRGIVKKRSKNNKKILHIINSIDLGGAENIFFNLMKASNKENLVIISLTSQGVYGKYLKKNGFKIFELNLKRNIFSLFGFIRLINLIIRYKPQIVHTWMYHSNLIGGLAAKFTGIRKIYWSIHHDYEYSNLFIMIEMKILLFLSYFIPDKIIYCSKSSKANHDKNGYKKKDAIVIENGVSTNIFKPNNQLRKEIRNELKINSDCILLGNISRYHPIKDHDTLFKSLIKLKNYKVKFKCVLVGRGLSNKNIKLVKKISHYNLENEIILFGECLKVYNLINSFDLNILSSKSESFPLTLIEAMSCGIPCISTDVGESKKIIGNTGWIVKTENSEEIAKCIYKVYRKKTLLKEKSKLARDRVLNLFTLEKMHKKYRSLYI